jgi:hypothetical protein
MWLTYRHQGIEMAIPFVDSFLDGRVSRIAAHVTKDAALADIAGRYRGQAWPS